MKKSKPVICKSCYDKGFYTVFQGSYALGDFPGDKNYFEAPTIQKRKCSVCNGRPRTYARKQLKLMLIGIRNGAFITPTLEKIMQWIETNGKKQTKTSPAPANEKPPR